MKTNSLKGFYFSFFFAIVFFFPLFPRIFEASQVHVNFVILTGALIVLFTYNHFKANRLYSIVFLYYSASQILLIPSLLTDIYSGSISTSTIFSFLRPTLLCMSFICLCALIQNYELYKIVRLVRIIISVSFIYVIAEVFFAQQFESIIHFLYKRESRLNLVGIGTAFFGTSYYAGFVFYSLTLVILVNFKKAKRDTKLLDLIVLLLGLALVALTQSKTMILSMVLSLAVIIMFSTGKRGIILSFGVICSIFLFILNMDNIFDYLRQYSLISVKQAETLIYSSSQSLTLSARLGQINESLSMVNENGGLFGVGLTPYKSFESWIALYLYRYGLLGLLNFMALSICLVIFGVKLIRNKSKHSFIGWLAITWGSTLPITQMSTPMMELGKMAFIANFILALIVVCYEKAQKCTSTTIQ
ncbi:hypothetical protein [Thalassotalea maritima]|uniref:hypothetical protein n=1 Tax=Thalassotalea maritima TaxID=3242416 RepID=UPI0035281AED